MVTVSEIMLIILSGTTALFSLVLPSVSLSTNQVWSPIVLTHYESPTMIHDPMKEYENKTLQKTMDIMLLDSMKE